MSLFRLGAHHRTNVNNRVQDFNVQRIYRHPNYHKPVSYAHDIALLLLDQPARLNGVVQPVCLPNKGDQQGGQCTVTGWGRLQHLGASPDYLMQVNWFNIRRKKEVIDMVHSSRLSSNFTRYTRDILSVYNSLGRT